MGFRAGAADPQELCRYSFLLGIPSVWGRRTPKWAHPDQRGYCIIHTGKCKGFFLPNSQADCTTFFRLFRAFSTKTPQTESSVTPQQPKKILLKHNTTDGKP